MMRYLFGTIWGALLGGTAAASVAALSAISHYSSTERLVLSYLPILFVLCCWLRHWKLSLFLQCISVAIISYMAYQFVISNPYTDSGPDPYGDASAGFVLGALVAAPIAVLTLISGVKKSIIAIGTVIISHVLCAFSVGNAASFLFAEPAISMTGETIMRSNLGLVLLSILLSMVVLLYVSFTCVEKTLPDRPKSAV